MSERLDIILPTPVPEDFDEIFPRQSVWQAKERLEQYVETNTKDDTVKVLKAFLDYLPLDGQGYIAGDICQAKTDKEVFQLTEKLVTGLLISSELY